MATSSISASRITLADVYFSDAFQQWSAALGDDDALAWHLAEEDIVARLEQEAAAARRAYLGAMPYDAYLQTAEWRERAEGAKVRAGWRCQLCNSGGELHAHHRTYERRGAELDEDLTVLCESCHRAFHAVRG